MPGRLIKATQPDKTEQVQTQQVTIPGSQAQQPSHDLFSIGFDRIWPTSGLYSVPRAVRPQLFLVIRSIDDGDYNYH